MLINLSSENGVKMTRVIGCIIDDFMTFQIVYVARNPKDTVVSYYHHNLLFKGLYEFRGDFKTFVELFMANTCELIELTI